MAFMLDGRLRLEAQASSFGVMDHPRHQAAMIRWGIGEGEAPEVLRSIRRTLSLRWLYHVFIGLNRDDDGGDHQAHFDDIFKHRTVGPQPVGLLSLLNPLYATLAGTAGRVG
jgi:hypothetical protein